MAKLQPFDKPDFSLEDKARLAGKRFIAGVDEAGRGPLAGPVVAAAVILDPMHIPVGLNDSKKLSEKKREELFELISQYATTAIAIADCQHIDRDNILQASLWAMAKALEKLPQPADLALIDGNKLPADAPCACQAIIGGDGKSLSIAAASIIAKVTRDRIMVELDKQYPEYGFAAHKGYGTARHMAALQQFGATRHHRRSFAPVRKLLE